MSDERNKLNRRDFIVGATSAAVLAGAGLGACSDDSGPPADGGPREAGADGAVDGPPPGEGGVDAASCSNPPQPLAPVTGSAPVVEVHDPKAIKSDNSFDQARVKAMLVAGLTQLTGETEIKKAWAKLVPDFKSSMKIGIKVNVLNSNLYNSAELISALVETLVADLGADKSKLWLWDRRTDELTRSKLTTASMGIKVQGTIASTSDSSGPGYENKPLCVIDRPTRLSRIVTEETDLTINLAMLKTHNISAMTGAMKNMYGCIDNPGEFHTNLNDYLPAIYRLDPIRTHMRLHITEGLLAVTRGDTTSMPDTLAARILLSTDPVAVDRHALDLINQLRKANPSKPLPPLPADKVKWIDGAAKLNLGTTSLDLRKVTM